jgi:hypothetical protein
MNKYFTACKEKHAAATAIAEHIDFPIEGPEFLPFNKEPTWFHKAMSCARAEKPIAWKAGTPDDLKRRLLAAFWPAHAKEQKLSVDIGMTVGEVEDREKDRKMNAVYANTDYGPGGV